MTTLTASNNPNSPYVPMAINRYGHCAFTLPEVVNGFGTLVFMTTGVMPPTPPLMQNSGVQAQRYEFSQ